MNVRRGFENTIVMGKIEGKRGKGRPRENT
jgi:hypothetical protein